MDNLFRYFVNAIEFITYSLIILLGISFFVTWGEFESFEIVLGIAALLFSVIFNILKSIVAKDKLEIDQGHLKLAKDKLKVDQERLTIEQIKHGKEVEQFSAQHSLDIQRLDHEFETQRKSFKIGALSEFVKIYGKYQASVLLLMTPDNYQDKLNDIAKLAMEMTSSLNHLQTVASDVTSATIFNEHAKIIQVQMKWQFLAIKYENSSANNPEDKIKNELEHMTSIFPDIKVIYTANLKIIEAIKSDLEDQTVNLPNTLLANDTLYANLKTELDRIQIPNVS